MVLLPLLINIVWIVVLNNSLDRAAHRMETSSRECLVITTMSRGALATTGILTMGNNAMMNGSYSIFKGAIHDLLAGVEQGLDQLAPIVPSELGYDKFHAKMRTLISMQRSTFLKSDMPEMEKDSLLVKLRRAKNWTAYCGAENTLIEECLDRVHDRFRKATLAEQEWQTKTELIVAIGLIVNLILACALAYFFQRNIATRIGILVRNSRKLPRHEPMLERVRGKDELTELDRELAIVGDELARTVEYRRTLMQMMAHDMRSPLMASAVSIDMLERFQAGKLNGQERQGIDLIKSSLNTCLELINDLLLLESLETGTVQLEMQTENVRELVSVTISDLGEIAQVKEITLVNEAESGYLDADREHIKNVLKRILTNAIERSPQKKQVLITSAVTSSHNSPRFIRVKVTDHGAAMDDATREKIFDKFYLVDQTNSAGATRLGLAVAKQIIEAHGGTIGAQSGESNGSIIWFELPLPAETTPDKKAQPG